MNEIAIAPTSKPGLERFDAEYPDSTSAALAWLEEHLRLDRVKLVRLGMFVAVPQDNDPIDFWSEVTRKNPDRAEQLEELLTDLIHHFHFDWNAAADFLHTPQPGSEPIPLPADIPTDAEAIFTIQKRLPGWTHALAEYFLKRL